MAAMRNISLVFRLVAIIKELFDAGVQNRYISHELTLAVDTKHCQLRLQMCRRRRILGLNPTNLK
jgi:hypothetical protein